ncbi:MAG: ATP-binding cassette domain-containing protein [Spirochaetaceae bacterium]|nr:ATP-binding cassette domain-containing protein [Spirochaetaceae bacterium]
MIVTAANLSFSYEHLILNNLSFSLQQGETLAIIGSSGVGKSTLLKIIAGLLPPTGGDLFNNAKKPIYVSQEDSLLNWLTIIQNVALPYTIKGEPLAKIKDKALTALSLVGLEGYADSYPHQLSGGMKKRAELARALAYEGDLILLDEPFSALDILNREKLNVLVAQLTKQTGAGLILVTHSIDEACYLADKILLLNSPPHSEELLINDKAGNNSDDFILSEQSRANSNHLRLALKNNNEAIKTAKTPAKNVLFNKFKQLGLAVISLITFLLAISLVKTVFNIPDFLLPYPATVARLFFTTLFNGFIFKDLSYTIMASLGGFGLALLLALPCGYTIARFKPLKELLLPPLIAANTIPIVALAPFIVMWVGLGLTPKIITAALIVFFPILITSITAFRLARKQTAMHLFFYKPNLLRGLFLLELPASLPTIFSGIKISLATSVVGAVIGEFISGADGLGSLLTIAKASFNTPLMFVALVWLVILGLTYYAAAALLEKLCVK